MLKAENLQRTGAFKLRGAVAKLAALGDEARRGVVTGSAGNHALALACAARRTWRALRGLHAPATRRSARSKAPRRYGATVRLETPSLADAMAAAHTEAAARGLTFVHPFDDLDVVAGQATLGLELLEDVEDLAAVVVPLGGGGLAGGLAVAVKRARPEVRVVGVQAGPCAAYPASLAAGHPVEIDPRPTIADGIAVRRPGELTLPLVARYVDDVVVVSDDEIAEAMVLLLEQSKLVVEGAGAVATAARARGPGRCPGAGHDGLGAVGWKRRRDGARCGRAAPRDGRRPQPRAGRPHRRPPRRAGSAAHRARRSSASTWST